MRIVLVALLCCLSIHVYGGKIVGKVSDEKTGDVLIGATVMVKGSAIGTATDIDGNYVLTVAEGTHTLEVKYIGYQTKEVSEVVVKGDEITTVNIIISEASSTLLGEVVVRSSLKKENISALYTMQKNSISVSSGISADLIRRSPDRNTGEVLKRVSGASIQNGKFVVIRGLSERYNAAMINGAQMQSTEPDRKAFSYDVIPSNLIDNIIISKTASAELPGDFAGGVVQVLTRDVPDNNFYDIGLSLGYNTQSTFQDFKSNGKTAVNYFGIYDKNDQLPVSFGTSRKFYKERSDLYRYAATRQLNNSYGEVISTALPNSSLQFSMGNVKNFKNGGKLGAVIGVVHRNSYTTIPKLVRGTWDKDADVNSYSEEASYRFNSSLAGLANFSYVNGRNKLSFRNIYNTIHDMNYYAREGFSVSSNQQYRLNSSVPYDRQLYSGQLDGDHALNDKGTKINWNLNYASLAANQQDLRTLYYNRMGSLQEGSFVADDEAAPYKIVERNSRRFFSTLKDKTYGGNLSLNLPFTMFERKQALKVGYLASYKTRDFDARIFAWERGRGFNNSLAMAPMDMIFDKANIGHHGFELEEETNNTDAYTANSFLNAGYVMLDNHLSDKFRLSWGVRIESYSQNLRAVNLSSQIIDKTDIFTDVLPSINFSYAPNDLTKVRLSGSRTVNRPEFREIAPFAFVDYENNWQVTGNPNLTRANITNVDLRYEYYPAPGEVITVGAFYKLFENPIENRMDEQSNLDLLIFGFNNAPTARAIGAELDVRKKLSFIADNNWLDNITLGANVTYTHSRVNIDSATFGTDEARPLQGQSPYLINLSVLYNDPKTGLGISALYNWVGERIFVVGNKTVSTTWENARNVIDLQISKPVLRNRGELKLTISDLLNQPYTFYWNYDDKTGYDSGTDRIFQQYKTGTSFTLGFTYRLAK